MKEAKPFVIDYVYAQSVECEKPCEGRLSRTVLREGEGETPSLYSTSDQTYPHFCVSKKPSITKLSLFFMYSFSTDGSFLYFLHPIMSFRYIEKSVE